MFKIGRVVENGNHQSWGKLMARVEIISDGEYTNVDYFIDNPDAVNTEEEHVLVRFEPEDQFAHVISMEKVEKAFEALRLKFDNDQVSP